MATAVVVGTCCSDSTSDSTVNGDFEVDEIIATRCEISGLGFRYLHRGDVAVCCAALIIFSSFL